MASRVLAARLVPGWLKPTHALRSRFQPLLKTPTTAAKRPALSSKPPSDVGGNGAPDDPQSVVPPRSIRPTASQTASPLAVTQAERRGRSSSLGRFHGLPIAQLCAEYDQLSKTARQRTCHPDLPLAIDAIAARVSLVPGRVVHRAVVAAEHAGLHASCVGLFFAWHGHVVGTNSDTLLFTVTDAVVDAAFALQRHDDLVRIAEIASAKVRATPNDVPSDFAVCRALWRLVCLENRWRVAGDASKLAAVATRCADVLSRHLRVSSQGSSPVLAALSDDAVLRACRRFVRYARGKDDGEMHWFYFCHRHHLLRNSRPPEGSDTAAAHPNATAIYLALLRSCKPGVWCDAALAYYHELRRHPSMSGRITEIVVHALLGVLTAGKEYKLILPLIPGLLASDPPPSHTVLGVLAAAASEVPGNTHLVLDCWSLILRADDASNVDAGSNEVSERPSPFSVFHVLTALGKCGVENFPELMNLALNRKLIRRDPESEAFLRLQWAHNTNEAAEVMRSVERSLQQAQSPVPLTERLCNQMLQIALRSDTDDMIERFQHFVNDLGFYRGQWLELLVLWSERRRSTLTADQLAFVAGNVRRHAGVNLDADEFNGMRPAAALILHDDKIGSLAAFRRSGAIPPPSPIADPRAHMLRRGVGQRSSVVDVSGTTGTNWAVSVAPVYCGLASTLPSPLRRAAAAAVVLGAPTDLSVLLLQSSSATPPLDEVALHLMFAATLRDLQVVDPYGMSSRSDDPVTALADLIRMIDVTNATRDGTQTDAAAAASAW